MIRVKFFVCNPFRELCYVAWEESSSHCLVVDPGLASDAEWQRLQHFLTEQGLTPEFVLVTHNHTDHVAGTGYLAAAYPGIDFYGSFDDQNHLPPIAEQNEMFYVDMPVYHVPLTRDVREGDVLWLTGANGSRHRIEVIDCPGHSHHGLCYYLPDDGVLFSGDVLFAGSVGRSDLGIALGGDGRLLLEGIAQKLYALPSDVCVYPGHGLYTTIGYERESNPYV